MCAIITCVYTHIFTRPGERDMHVLFSEGCSQIFVERYFFGVYIWMNGHPGKWVWLMGTIIQKMERVVRF